MSPHFTLIASMRDAQRVLFCVSGGFCLLIFCVDPSLHLWGEVNCIIIAHIFYVLLNSAYKCFVEHFVSKSMRLLAVLCKFGIGKHGTLRVSPRVQAFFHHALSSCEHRHVCVLMTCTILVYTHIFHVQTCSNLSINTSMF